MLPLVRSINAEVRLRLSKRIPSLLSEIVQRQSCQQSVVKIDEFNDFCMDNLQNEPVRTYECEDEVCALKEKLKEMQDCIQDIPIVVGDEELRSGAEKFQVMPYRHAQKIAKYYYAEPEIIIKAVSAATCAQKTWDEVPLKERIQIWEKAADLMSNKYRYDLVAATMLGQAKTVVQAEIDAAAELIDFTRMNTMFLKNIAQYQPLSPDSDVTKNYNRFRGIDGFVAAISPFNFTAIGGNLAFTPALMGNGVVWKPSDTAMLSNWLIFKIMREAGVPAGVVNFVPAEGATFGKIITESPELAGINFTGSVPTFQTLWSMVAKNLKNYYNFPRLIGECGGKNFHFVHESADVDSVVACTIRSAFEYSGQKCSACSRLFVPESLWENCIKAALIEKACTLKVGDVTDFSVFSSAVIDDRAFQRIMKHLSEAKKNADCEVLLGGVGNNTTGYFIEPTIVVVKDVDHPLLKDELFGPVLSVYVYKNDDLCRTMDSVGERSKYALTGAVFGKDEAFLKQALQTFKNSAGNFYINDKSTGSIVGQQPFGGGRMSGTNDKAGGPWYILRWTSPQSIKETFKPMTDISYPYMKSEWK